VEKLVLKMTEPAVIVAILQNSSVSALKGLKALVTAGPTYEPIDPVRYLSNASSESKDMLLQRPPSKGADVALITGPTSPSPMGATLLPVQTAEEM
jgi:phosphopantothenoylcysteine decarboxylase/phosphopantothenate--cysteine ligase